MNINIDDISQDFDSPLRANTEFIQAQKNDPMLNSYWTRARAGSTEFTIRNGLLYKKAQVNSTSHHEHLLVIPQQYQQQILVMGHDSQFAGHCGVKKTLIRIQNVFYFQRMRQKVKKHVRSCSQCQYTAPIKRKDRYPLQKIQVMNTYPFEDLTIDFLGTDLPRSKTGNRFLLVLICSASRFVHAIPMKSMKSNDIADKLIEHFCTYSVPRIIRMDNASGFRSQFFTELRSKLGIEANFSTVYHPNSHGVVEKANQTLLQMLRKFIDQNPQNWDKIFPMLLYAIRSVPNESTKISPNELVFGRQLRGILEIARENWENGDKAKPRLLKVSTTEYLERLRSDLEIARKAAQANSNEAHQKSKLQYDKSCTQRELQIGDQVLILQPTSGKKLYLKWTGPYEITSKLPNANYEVQINNRRTV